MGKWAVWVLVATLGVSACSTAQPYVQAAKDGGAKAMDGVLSEAEWVICQAASVGAVKRRYGQSAEAAAYWRGLCALGYTDWTPGDPAGVAK